MGGDDLDPQIQGLFQPSWIIELMGARIGGRHSQFGTGMAEEGDLLLGEDFMEGDTSVIFGIDLLAGSDSLEKHGTLVQESPGLRYLNYPHVSAWF